ncbi:hypothetical protein D3C87_1605620 [compost metagenome]
MGTDNTPVAGTKKRAVVVLPSEVAIVQRLRFWSKKADSTRVLKRKDSRRLKRSAT